MLIDVLYGPALFRALLSGGPLHRAEIDGIVDLMVARPEASPISPL